MENEHMLFWYGVFCIGLVRHDMAIHKMLDELGLDDDSVRKSPEMCKALFKAISLLYYTPAGNYLSETWYL